MKKVKSQEFLVRDIKSNTSRSKLKQSPNRVLSLQVNHQKQKIQTTNFYSLVKSEMQVDARGYVQKLVGINGHTHKHQNKGSDVIRNQNIQLAQRILSQSPVINSRKLETDYRKHQTDVALIQKYQAAKLVDSTGIAYQLLNASLGSKFNKSSYASLLFLNQISRIKRFILLSVDELTLFGVKHTSFRDKNPAYYQWIVNINDKEIKRTQSFDYDDFLTNLAAFTVPDDYVEIELQLNKIKQINEDWINNLQGVQFSCPNSPNSKECSIEDI